MTELVSNLDTVKIVSRYNEDGLLTETVLIVYDSSEGHDVQVQLPKIADLRKALEIHEHGLRDY
jgi:hypothetical protein